MKKIAYTLMATVAGVVLLFSYRTSLGGTVPTTAAAPAAEPAAHPTTSSTGKVGAPAPHASAAGPAPATHAALKTGTFTGPAENTPYGTVQVAVTVSGGKITRVAVPHYPDDSGRSHLINSAAVPQLVSEATRAQSAQVAMVSGATYTSTAYAQSLQAALDQARA